MVVGRVTKPANSVTPVAYKLPVKAKNSASVKDSSPPMINCVTHANPSAVHSVPIQSTWANAINLQN